MASKVKIAYNTRAMNQQPTPETMTLDTCMQLLRQARTIAFVGLSDKPERYSNKVARYFMQKGYTIIPVNPAATDTLGLKTYATLADIPTDTHLDIVAVYRNANDVLAHVQEARARGNVGVIWLAEGVHSREAEQFAHTNGIPLITDRCIMKVDLLQPKTEQ